MVPRIKMMQAAVKNIREKTVPLLPPSKKIAISGYVKDHIYVVLPNPPYAIRKEKKAPVIVVPIKLIK
jgi:hypothetical protein